MKKSTLALVVMGIVASVFRDGHCGICIRTGRRNI